MGSSSLPKMRISRLTIAIMAIACMATAGLLGYTGFSSGDNTVSVYGTDNSDALELRGAVFAKCGADNEVDEIVFTVAIPEGASPVNFAAPPNNVVKISYTDEQQQISDIPWKAKEYVAGDNDTILEPGETFLITGSLGKILKHDLEAAITFIVEVRTPDNEVLAIKRIIPENLAPIMNLE